MTHGTGRSVSDADLPILVALNYIQLYYEFNTTTTYLLCI